MRFISLVSLVVFSLSGALAAQPDANTFLLGNRDIAVGRDALDAAEARSADSNTYRSYSKPADNVVLVREHDATSHEPNWSVALVDDEKAEEHYKRYYSATEGDAGETKRAAGESPNVRNPRGLFERASRCGQFCGRSRDCTVDPRCPLCAHVQGNTRWQLSCQARG